MNIELVEAPVVVSAGRIKPRYGELVLALSTPGQWIKVPLIEITGKNRPQRTHAVQQVATQAGFKVWTHMDTDHIYICRQPSVEGGQQ